VAVLTPILGADEVVATRRLRLRAIAAPDLAAAWLAAALAPDWQIADVEPRLDSAVAAEDGGGGFVGLAVALPGRPRPDAATFALVTVDPARRYAGLGAELVMAVETLLRERCQVVESLVPVPAGRGLAVYFWLRLGYRPLTMSEAPGPVSGLTDAPYDGIWMSRRLDAEG
jgi:GNAT superfamily N-acetyltransferase